MLTLRAACDEARARHHQRVAMHVVHVRVHRVLERDLPVAAPVDLAREDQGLVVEELLGHVLLDRRRIAVPDPHEDDALERPRGVALRLGARLAADAGIGALGEHSDVLAALVEHPAVVGACDRAAVMAIALAQPRAAVRADVLDGDDVAGRAAKEAHVLAEERDLHRPAPADAARADLRVGDRRVPVVAQAERRDQRPDIAAELRDRAVRGRRAHGSNTAKHLLELNDHVSTKSHAPGLRPSSSMAPTSMYQLSISCCPDASMDSSGVVRHVS